MSTSTIVDDMITLARKFGVAVPYIPNISLNDHLNILSGDQGVPITNGKARYLIAGNGGHDTPTSGNVVGISAKVRLPQFQALYNQMPLVLKPVTGDLSFISNNEYKLLKVIQLPDGNNYVAGYALELSGIDAITPEFVVETNNNGVITEAPFIHSQNMTHGEIITQQGNTGVTQRLLTTFDVPFTFTQSQIDNYNEAAELIHGATGFSIISELALVSASEVTNTLTVEGTPHNYNEIINSVVVASTDTGRILDFGLGSDVSVLKFGSAKPYHQTS